MTPVPDREHAAPALAPRRRDHRVRRAAVVLSLATLPALAMTTASAATGGVQADGAVVTADGKYLDVFATSLGDKVQVDGTPTVAMAHDAGTTRFYARIALSGAAPASVTVRNLSDNPVSTSTVATKVPSGITITRAEYDGKGKLTVGATSSKGEALTATGLGALTNPSGTDFAVQAPPRTVTVTGASGSESAPVVVTGGDATPTSSTTTSTSAPTTTSSSSPTTTSSSTTTSTTTSTTSTTSSAPTTTSATAAPAPSTQNDVVTVGTARHRLGTELRIEGSALVPGTVRVTTPTSVTVYDTTPVAGVARNTVLGTVAVDRNGSFSLRLRPGPTAQVTSVFVQSTSGGSTTSAVATR